MSDALYLVFVRNHRTGRLEPASTGGAVIVGTLDELDASGIFPADAPRSPVHDGLATVRVTDMLGCGPR